jgi:hypothetical protein
LPAEEQLILAAMKLVVSETEMDRIDALIPAVSDWKMIGKLAVERGVGPLLLKKLEASKQTANIPAEVLALLRQSYFITLRRSLWLYEAYKTIATAFNAKGLKFIVLKGACLSEMLYKDPGLRQFSDIDILVEKDRAAEFLAILRELGFVSREKELLHSDFVKQYLDFVHYPPMDKDGISVEVHIKLHQKKYPYRMDIPVILHDAVPVDIQHMPAHALHFDDLLIHLCVHADKHFNEGQIQFTCYNDITNLLCNPQQPIDWNRFVARCRQHRSEQVVFRHLLLVQHFCGAPLPAELVSRYRKALTGDDCRQFLQFLRGEFRSKQVKKSLLSTSWTLLKDIDRFSDKIRFIGHMLFPPKSYMIERFQLKNPSHFRLYYFVRIWRLLLTRFK